jgi:hypothetical protein
MPFISYGPLNSMLFGIYGNTLRLLHDDGETPTYFHVWLAGTAAGSILGELEKWLNEYYSCNFI